MIYTFEEQTSTIMVAFKRQTSAMMDASQKQDWDLVNRMIRQEVLQGNHGLGPWEDDTQTWVLEATHHQVTFCPPPSEACANRSGGRKQQ